jgi:hypothetical protein
VTRASLLALTVGVTAVGSAGPDAPAVPEPAGAARALAAAPPRPAVLSVAQIARQDVPALRGSQPDTLAEPDVAVSPRDPMIALAVAQDGRYPDGGAVGITYAWTRDGGRHWEHRPLPGLTPVTGGSATWRRASDPVAAFDGRGRAFVSMLLVTKGGSSAVAVSRSADGGRTFGRPVVVHRAACEHCDDKPWLVADTGPRSPRQGRLYLFWTRLLFDASGHRDGARQLVSRSNDQGRTWSAPVGVTARHRGTQNSQPMPRPDGTLVDAFLDLGSGVDAEEEEAAAVAPGRRAVAAGRRAAAAPRRALLTRISRDGGRTWVRGGTVTGRVGTGPAGLRCCLPSATSDPGTGRLYAAWVSVDARRALLSTSTDGRRWSPARTVNRPTGAARVVNVDVSAYGGVVAVSYGLTTAAAGPARRPRQRVAVSRDAGASFGPAAVLGPAGNYAYAARAPIVFPGDYVGSALRGTTLYAVWCVPTRPPRAGARFHQVAYGAALRVR